MQKFLGKFTSANKVPKPSSSILDRKSSKPAKSKRAAGGGGSNGVRRDRGANGRGQQQGGKLASIFTASLKKDREERSHRSWSGHESDTPTDGNPFERCPTPGGSMWTLATGKAWEAEADSPLVTGSGLEKGEARGFRAVPERGGVFTRGRDMVNDRPLEDFDDDHEDDDLGMDGEDDDDEDGEDSGSPRHSHSSGEDEYSEKDGSSSGSSSSSMHVSSSKVESDTESTGSSGRGGRGEDEKAESDKRQAERAVRRKEKKKRRRERREKKKKDAKKKRKDKERGSDKDKDKDKKKKRKKKSKTEASTKSKSKSKSKPKERRLLPPRLLSPYENARSDIDSDDIIFDISSPHLALWHVTGTLLSMVLCSKRDSTDIPQRFERYFFSIQYMMQFVSNAWLPPAVRDPVSWSNGYPERAGVLLPETRLPSKKATKAVSQTISAIVRMVMKQKHDLEEDVMEQHMSPLLYVAEWISGLYHLRLLKIAEAGKGGIFGKQDQEQKKKKDALSVLQIQIPGGSWCTPGHLDRITLEWVTHGFLIVGLTNNTKMRYVSPDCRDAKPETKSTHLELRYAPAMLFSFLMSEWADTLFEAISKTSYTATKREYICGVMFDACVALETKRYAMKRGIATWIEGGSLQIHCDHNDKSMSNYWVPGYRMSDVYAALGLAHPKTHTVNGNSYGDIKYFMPEGGQMKRGNRHKWVEWISVADNGRERWRRCGGEYVSDPVVKYEEESDESDSEPEKEKEVIPVGNPKSPDPIPPVAVSSDNGSSSGSGEDEDVVIAVEEDEVEIVEEIQEDD